MCRYADLNGLMNDLYYRLNQLSTDCGMYDSYYCGFREAVEVVERLEDLDVVDVVRCKCCMFRSTIDDGYTRLQCPTGFICQLTNKLVRESDFCSYGKREVDV